MKRLRQSPETFKAYDQVISDQLVNNMTEKISENQSENLKELFLPHIQVIRQNEESKKIESSV